MIDQESYAGLVGRLLEAEDKNCHMSKSGAVLASPTAVLAREAITLLGQFAKDLHKEKSLNAELLADLQDSMECVEQKDAALREAYAIYGADDDGYPTHGHRISAIRILHHGLDLKLKARATAKAKETP